MRLNARQHYLHLCSVAVEEFDKAPELHDLMSNEFCQLYRAIKMHELDEFLSVVSPWEREHLLLSV